MKEGNLGARRNYVDFLKAFSAIIIIIYHYRHLAYFEAPSAPLPFPGFLAIPYRYGLVVVELFFLLSGFLLIQNYLVSNKKAQNVKDFIGRKIIRLYPAFILTSCVCIVLQLFAYYVTGGFVLNLSTNLCGIFLDLTLLKSGLFSSSVPLNVPAWFLTPLFVCYFLFWYVFYENRMGIDRKFIVAGTLMLIGMATLLNQWDVAILNMRMGRAFSSFFAGVLLGGYCAYSNGYKQSRVLFGWVVVILSLAMIKADLSGNLYVSTVFMFTALIFSLEKSKYAEMIFKKKVVRAIWVPIHSLSYELFLIHYPILTAIAVLNRIFDISYCFGTAWFFGCYILSCVLLAIVIKGLEKRMQLSLKYFLVLHGDE